jgi:lysophospholipase L1-like esterase
MPIQLMVKNTLRKLFRLALLVPVSILQIGCLSPQDGPQLPADVPLFIPYLPGLVADGKAGDWSRSYQPIKLHSDVCGTMPDSSDFRVAFRMAWNDRGIGILVEIIDDTLYEDADDYWKGDGLELFLSRFRGCKEILQISVRPGFDQPASMAACRAYDQLRYRSLDTAERGIRFASRKTPEGYLLEGEIPFEVFGFVSSQDSLMAVQLYVNDADRKDDPDNFSLPWYPARESYRNPYALQSIRLTPDRHPRILPELRACVLDEKMVRFRVIMDQSHREPIFLTLPGTFRHRCSKTQLNEWTLPANEILSGEEMQVGLMQGDLPLQVLDLVMIQRVFEGTDPPEWYESDIRLFEILDRYDPPPDSATLFTGSSTIRRWHSLPEDMYPLKVINRGFGGSVMKELNQIMDRIVVPYKPARIVVYEGDNDIARGTDAEDFLADCKEFISRCQQQLPGTEIIFLSIKPSPSRMRHWHRMDEANRMLADLCHQHENVRFVDISTPMFAGPGILKNDIYAEDRLHLNERGYALINEVILENIFTSLN